MDEDDSPGDDSGVVWNFDDAESKLIFEMKLAFIRARDSWDLDGSYLSLWRLKSEIKPLFDETVIEEIDNEFKDLNKLRSETDKFSGLTDEDKGLCMQSLNDFYEKICVEAVGKQYYFRKKKEYVGL